MATTGRWVLVNALVGLAAYGVALLLLALTDQLTTAVALLSAVPVVVIFGAMAWVQRPHRRSRER